MTVCIVSNVDDAHAICVELALKKKGEKVVLWHWLDFPSIERHSFHFDGLGGVASSMSEELASSNVSLWIHRGLRPYPSPNLHPADVRFVLAEAKHMLDGMLNEVARNAFCVNPLNAVSKLRSKINELTLAIGSGLRIPATLVSNDSQVIREFFENHEHVVMKHSSQMHWETPNGSVNFPYTSKVEQEHLKNPAQIQSCPTIFQVMIQKKFELRIVFMGDTIFPVKIDSQRDQPSLDWRKDYNSLPPCEVFELPAQELNLIKQFIKNSGLIYGSIDIVVDKNDRYFFLEVNETGQFLWIEDILPELPLLDCFANLLISRDERYKYKKNKTQIFCKDMDDYISKEALGARRQGHVVNVSSGKIIES